jgi:hypothetical protein
LGDWVPWTARISRHHLAILLPDIQDGGIEGELHHRLTEVVAYAAQECEYGGAVQWRLVVAGGGVECADIETRLSTLQSGLDAETWRSLLPTEE